MGIGVSLALIALGAILTWAITSHVPGLNLDIVGAILMTVGTLGLLMSFLFWSPFAPCTRSGLHHPHDDDRPT